MIDIKANIKAISTINQNRKTPISIPILPVMVPGDTIILE